VVAARQEVPRHRFERPVVTAGEGPQRLRPDVELLAGAAPFDTVQRTAETEPRWRAYGGLSDLRLSAADGREVPYLLVYAPAAEPQWIPAAILALADTEKTSGFEADLGGAEDVDAIRVQGLPSPFLKRLLLEGSGDRAHWIVLAAEGTLFDLPQDALHLDTIPFRAGAYRYLRVTWNDTNTGRLPLPRAVSARRARADALVPAPITAQVSVERRTSEPGVSRYRIRLPGARLPIVALSLAVGGGHVFRRATVTESRLSGHEAAPAEIGRATLSRIVRDGASAAALRIPISPPREPELSLIVEDGSNPPLEVSGATLEFAELPWIYFEAPGGAVTARYGDRRARAPKYDLEAARESIRLETVSEARWGAPPEPRTSEPAAAPAGAPAPGAPLDPSSFSFRRDVPQAPQRLAVLPLDAGVLAHSRRFGDVRLLDEEGRQVPYLLERREEPLSIDLPLAAHQARARELQPVEGRRPSTYVVRLPFADLPPGRLVLETPARVFSRNVQVGFERPANRQRREAWFEIHRTAVWQHADPEAPAAALSLEIHSGKDQEVVVAVDEGDNTALPITGARLLLPSYRLRFYHPGTPLRLVYGNDDLAPPQYDLALLAPYVMGAEAQEVAAAAPDASRSAPSRPSIVSPRMFWMGLGLAVLVLLALIARLLRRAP
jgi:hypothetical protein